MKKITTAAIFILLFCFGIFAQKSNSRINPDFEGTWILEDADIHYPFDDKKYSEVFTDETLTISKNDDGIKIIKSFKFKDEPKSFEMILFPDKRGEENLILFGVDRKLNIKSESYLKNNSIIREYKLSFPGHISKRKEVYKLSDDGKTLTVRFITERDIFPSLSNASAHGISKDSLTDNYDEYTYRKS